jgi:hypothetical protein
MQKLILGIALLFLADACSLAQSPKPTPQTINASQSAKRNNGTPQNEARSSGIDTYSTAVIALFTALTFGGFVVQISTTRKTERAWLIVNPLEPAPALGFASVLSHKTIE